MGAFGPGINFPYPDRPYGDPDRWGRISSTAALRRLLRSIGDRRFGTASMLHLGFRLALAFCRGGNLNWYFYPEFIYHVTHERLVYPELGIPGNDLIVERAMPKMARALMESELSDDRPFISCCIIAGDNRMDALPRVSSSTPHCRRAHRLSNVRVWVHHHWPIA